MFPFWETEEGKSGLGNSKPAASQPKAAAPGSRLVIQLIYIPCWVICRVSITTGTTSLKYEFILIDNH
jgi:hypothetical protein